MTWPDKTPKLQPPRIILNAVEGFGKTTAGAYAPDPVILMASQETGYTTLYGAGRVPRCPTVTCDTWHEVLDFLQSLCGDPQNRQTLVLDALGGFERLCHEQVQYEFFDDNFDKFMAFHKGYERSVGEWMKLLSMLDRLQRLHGFIVLVLSHTQIRPFKNPDDEDYDRYVADCYKQTWSVTHKWADAVLFGNFFTTVEKKNNKAKGVGGTQRVIYTERRAAFDAKNRYGMQPSFNMPDDPKETWSTIWNAITGGK